ncbi:MAG TPA: carboxymuconolactone decarboxylase family protein [Blastocatellia bacterium]|jgi:AhpD family alkylhydroperoxidase|nr:carboxymuconolactone decarboxylase family protein [Blastocatellia bacterium]
MKLFIALSMIITASFATSFAQEIDPLTSLEAMNQAAKQKVDASPNVQLADENADFLSGADALEAGRVPNYARGLALLPEAARPLAEAFKAYIYGGSIAPETKMAMGLRVAQVYGSAYPAVHLQRLLRASERGKKLLASLQANDLASMSSSEQAATRYAELLTRDIHGVNDAEFQKTRALFNDSQIVELTMTTCFFNYFLRYCEGANLPVEKWALDEPVAKVAVAKFEPPPARVALVSDDQMKAVVDTLNAAKTPANNWNIGVANSQRAFLLVPGITEKWRGYTTVTRKYESVSREIKLHISFAISMANGCRYCTLHQVLGLRRLGVDPARLAAMAKDDSALTPRELTAVTFARKITRGPAKLTKDDYAALLSEFKEQGALEVLLQCGNFAYMNRFTDGLRLPSEDEAIKVYRETYGGSFEELRNAKRD